MFKSLQNQQKMQDQFKQAKESFVNEMELHPPTIGLIGVSGTGKSSTINRMFKTNLAISHTVACTKAFATNALSVKATQPEYADVPIQLRVMDAPGLGEDILLDPKYINMYRQNLAACDVILWVLHARNRAIALDQMYLQQLSEFADRMVFGINQVDLVYPMDWDSMINLPSEAMEQNIDEIVKDKSQKLGAILNRNLKVIPYSAEKGYRLEELFAKLIESCPPKRRWIFSILKNFRLEDFYSIR